MNTHSQKPAAAGIRSSALPSSRSSHCRPAAAVAARLRPVRPLVANDVSIYRIDAVAGTLTFAGTVAADETPSSIAEKIGT
jgi:hypothetical protein